MPLAFLCWAILESPSNHDNFGLQFGLSLEVSDGSSEINPERRPKSADRFRHSLRLNLGGDRDFSLERYPGHLDVLYDRSFEYQQFEEMS
jgi:hypothetical protein